ncbi:MAG: isocitrate/isopropylmalate family dehydrogenase [Pseudomonadota bacterium]
MLDDAGRPPGLLVLAGDGIGPEITAATLAVLRAAAARAGVALDLEEREIGFRALEAEGTTIPEAVVEAAGAADGIILGPVSHNAYPPREAGGLNPSGELRKRLKLFANIRPVVTPPGVRPATGTPLDLVIYRENTEGFYADRNLHLGPGEIMPTEDMVLSFRRVTRGACLAIARAAFAAARARKGRGAGPGRVTAVHKANVLRFGDGLFLDCVREVARTYPEIALEEILVDAMCAHLVRRPASFDVIVTTNMYGDILSDLATELAGSIGLAASLNAGEAAAMAQAQHGSAPDIAGRDLANPASLIGSTAMLFDWLAERRGDARLVQVAALIRAGLAEALRAPETRTRDLGGTLGTAGFAAGIAGRIAAMG